MNNNLENKVAIVTGASKGIGAEIAKQMGASGAKVRFFVNFGEKLFFMKGLKFTSSNSMVI